MNKKCGKCKKNKEIREFHKNSCSYDGVNNTCKECRIVTSKTYYENHKDERLRYAKKVYQKDPDKYLEKNRKWAHNNRDKKLESTRKSHEKWYSKEENKKKKQEYAKKHRDKKREYDRQYKIRREKTDVVFKLTNRLRTRMCMALEKEYKTGSAVRDLGCSIKKFKKHIESLWQPGMSWDNYGKGPKNWSLDHKIPLSYFDLTNRKQFLKACHYTNIQPMWHIDNMKKHDKVFV